MMKNKNLIFVAVFVILGIFVCWVFLQSKKPEDISTVSDKEIISFLQKNSDAKEYMEDHIDFKIQDKIILTKDMILAGQNGENFKEVYQGLELENNRYIKVDLMNLAGNSGMVTVIDFNSKEVSKAYGIILLSAIAN